MTEVISTLIDKQDNFEIVRDQIALILATEVVNQMSLAVMAAEDPNDWKLRIFTEAFNPIEQFLNVTKDTPASELVPIINIWYDASSFPENRGEPIERQGSDTVYNIDCYGYGLSSNNPAGGHNPGDKEASLEAQRAVRLVRNILMSAINIKLQLPATTVGVGLRWPQSITAFQPQLDATPVQNVHGARIAFKVSFNEFSPQIEPNTLELVSVDIKRTEDGEIVLKADYPSTP